MIIGKIKSDTPEPQHHAIPEVGEKPKSYIIVERTGTHKYNTRSSTKRVNHVTTFKNVPNIFKMGVAGKIKINIDTYYLVHVDLKK